MDESAYLNYVKECARFDGTNSLWGSSVDPSWHMRKVIGWEHHPDLSLNTILLIADVFLLYNKQVVFNLSISLNMWMDVEKEIV